MTSSHHQTTISHSILFYFLLEKNKWLVFYTLHFLQKIESKRLLIFPQQFNTADWKQELLRKQLNLHMKLTSPLQKSIQSWKQWIKFCRLLVLVPGCCTGKLTGCILGCSHLWSSEPVSSFPSQDRRRNTPFGWLNTERADAERHTDLMWTLFFFFNFIYLFFICSEFCHTLKW